MWRAKRFSWTAALAGVALLVGGASVVTSQEKKTDGQKTRGQVMLSHFSAGGGEPCQSGTSAARSAWREAW